MTTIPAENEAELIAYAYKHIYQTVHSVFTTELSAQYTPEELTIEVV